MSKLSILRAKIIAHVEKMDDEALLTAMLIFASQSSKNPEKVKSQSRKTARKSSAPKAPVKIADTISVLEYTYKDKDMLAIQTNGKPDEATLATLRDFKDAQVIRFYRNAPTNPFGNSEPFWAGKATAALKSAFPATA